MSDPVTQAEIEDVLSSIRRLVSEDGRGTAKPAPVSEAPKPASRLILTPALRVAGAADEGPEAEPVLSEKDQEVGEDIAPESESEIEPEGAQWGDAGAQSPKAAEQTQPQFVAETDISAQQHEGDLHDRVETVDAAAGQASDSAPEAPWHDPEATLYQAAAGSSDFAQEQEEPQQAAPEDQGADEASEPELSEEALTANSERVSAVVQKIAELEAKVAHAQDQWEPDGSSSDPYAGTNIETLEWTDHIEDEAEEPLEEASQDAPGLDAQRLAEEAALDETLAAVDSLAAEESYLDEDSLRELVADIVRSELQGALGERITRNVRKLVRREIQRALAAQDLI